MTIRVTMKKFHITVGALVTGIREVAKNLADRRYPALQPIRVVATDRGKRIRRKI